MEFVREFLDSDFLFVDDFLNQSGIKLLTDVSSDQKLKLQEFKKIRDLNKSGYAGINSKGTIVDRRKFPDAIPVQQNSLFGVVKPKELKTKK